ncbi:MAG: hypothetical protein FWH04_10160 [Oscillospiraceae bacterium]|nr:hypothetical protein [Oscillospiraceae bacterium]
MNVTKTTTTPCVGGTQTPKPPGTSSDFAKVMAEQAAAQAAAESAPVQEPITDEERFAQIVRKYNGGATEETFMPMLNELRKAGLITTEQIMVISSARNWIEVECRYQEELLKGAAFNFEAYIKNLRISSDDILLNLADLIKKVQSAGGQQTDFSKNQDFIRGFFEKVSMIMTGQINTQEVNINE